MVKNLSLVVLLAGLAAATPVRHEARELPGVGLDLDKEGSVGLKPQSGVGVNLDSQKEGGKGGSVNVNDEGLKAGPKERNEKRDSQFPGVGVDVDKEGNVDVNRKNGVGVNVAPQKESGKGADVGVSDNGVSVDPKKEKPEKRGADFPGVGVNVDKEGGVDVSPQKGVGVGVESQKEDKGADVDVNGDGVKVDPKSKPQRRALEGIERPVIGGGRI